MVVHKSAEQYPNISTMDNDQGKCSVSPANLTVPCAICQQPTPYNPTLPMQQCYDCQTMRMSWSTQETYGFTGYPASTYGLPISTQDYQNYGFQMPNNQMQRGLTHDYYYQNARYQEPQHHSNQYHASRNESQMTPVAHFKRKAASPPTGNEYHNGKRMFTNNTAPISSSPLKHYTVAGQASQTHGHSPSESDEESDEEFVDAPEEQLQPKQVHRHIMEDRLDRESGDSCKSPSEDNTDYLGDQESDVASSSVDETIDDQGHMQAGARSEDDEAMSDHSSIVVQDDDAQSLSSNTNSDKSQREDDDEIEEVTPNEILLTKDNARAAKSAPKGTKSTFSTSYKTKPTSYNPSLGPDPVSDLSPTYTYLRDFHNRAKILIPRLPLAVHRYWIGVLNIDRKANTFTREQHFTWMKGNKFTTVSTVWHTYQNTTATDDFVLLLGMEKVDFKDCMQELDYFNEKKVMFRAVAQGHEHAGGRVLCQDVSVPTVGKAVEREVIEID